MSSNVCRFQHDLEAEDYKGQRMAERRERRAKKRRRAEKAAGKKGEGANTEEHLTRTQKLALKKKAKKMKALEVTPFPIVCKCKGKTWSMWEWQSACRVAGGGGARRAGAGARGLRRRGARAARAAPRTGQSATTANNSTQFLQKVIYKPSLIKIH